MTSHSTPTGFSPARRHRSTAASVCPALHENAALARAQREDVTRTREICCAVAVGSASARIVAARSLEETPVVVPMRRSTDTVNAVRCDSLLACTICGRSRRASSSSSIGTQMMPLVWRIMNATASGVARSAAMIRSPSFSRSSSSMMMTMRPALRSATISSTELSPAPGLEALLPPSGMTLAMGYPRGLRNDVIASIRVWARAATWGAFPCGRLPRRGATRLCQRPPPRAACDLAGVEIIGGTHSSVPPPGNELNGCDRTALRVVGERRCFRMHSSAAASNIADPGSKGDVSPA